MTNWPSLEKAFNHAARQLDNQFETTLEVRVAERTRIARDLHDTLLQSFHGLLYRFQAARFMFPERMEEGIQSLDAALVRTEQALEESRNSIQGLRLGLSAESELDQMLIANEPGTSFQPYWRGRLAAVQSDRGRRASKSFSNHQGGDRSNCARADPQCFPARTRA